MTATVTVAPEKFAKRMGWQLLALAMALPIFMALIGVIDARRAGQLTFYVGFAWLIASLISDLITRKRDATTKANGRIVAAALALVLALVSSFNVYNDAKKIGAAKKEFIKEFMEGSVEARKSPAESAASVPTAADVAAESSAVSKPRITNDADRAVQFMKGVQERAKTYAEHSAALDRELQSIDLSKVHTSEALTSQEAIRESRKTLERFKSLLADRENMVKQYSAQMEKTARSELNEHEASAFLLGARVPQDKALKAYADLNEAQLSSIKAIEDVLNFAEHILGRTTVKDGKIMFQVQSELDELKRLMQVFLSVAAKEEVVVNRTEELYQKTKQNLVDQLN